MEERGQPLFRLGRLDLTTGEDHTAFLVPSQSFLYEVDVHPRAGVVLAWTPPPEADSETSFDRSQLFLLDGDTPRHLACDSVPGRWCFFPEWSADGESVWFIGAGDGFSEDTSAGVLSRVSTTTGAIEQVHTYATEPTVSPDGAHIAWVAVDPDTGRRSLELGDHNGQHLTTLVHAYQVEDLGQPVFSADGQHIRLVVIRTSTTAWTWPSWGGTAYAHGSHDLPGDWWEVPIAGGPLSQVSAGDTIHYDGETDGEGRLVAATREGLVRMEGTEEVPLLLARGVRAVAYGP